MRMVFQTSPKRRISDIRWKLAAWAALLAGCSCASLAQRPTLMSYSPTQGAQGTSLTLTFTGTGFSARMLRLLISPAQGISVTGIALTSPTQITAKVQIAPTAAAGSYKLDLQVADHDMIAATPFMVTAAQPGCSTNFAAVANCGPAQPAIRELTPLSGRQGTSVLLTLTGANFVASSVLQMIPATGLTLGKPALVNANELQVQVGIAANAPLGPRSVVLLSGNLRAAAPNTFTVTPAPKPGGTVFPMQILRLVPSQITAGSQNVDLAIEGSNFVPGAQVTFTAGAGVPAGVMATGPVRYINSTEIHVSVSALATALPGGRTIVLQSPEQQQATGNRMLNVIAAPVTSGLPVVLKTTPISLQSFPLGKIMLDTPQWGEQWLGEIQENYGIPVLDDDAKFQWHEQNPGLADYYILNIYEKDGVTLLGSKRIDGVNVLALGGTMHVVPTYFRPDAAFLAQVLETVPKFKHVGFTYPSHSQPTSTLLNGVKVFQPPPQSSASAQLAEGDLQWEVVGYHTYNSSGVAPQATTGAKTGAFTLQRTGSAAQALGGGQQNATGQQSAQNQTVDIKVEVSDRWPLNRPLAPTGLACSGGGQSGTGLQAADVDATGNDPNNYAGDRFMLTGSFNLSDSPYATHPTLQPKPGSQCNNCLITPVGEVAFDNLFVDWGDGTIQSLSAPPSDPNMTNWNRGESLTLPGHLGDQGSVVHAYNNKGSYTIRVFQLSEADAQHVNASLLAASVDGPATSPFLQVATLSRISAAQGGNPAQNTIGNAFQTMLAQSAGAAMVKGGGAPAGPDLSAITARAFMIFCKGITLTVPEDLAADGPLHLMQIADPDFPGHDNAKPRLPIHLIPHGSAAPPEKIQPLPETHLAADKASLVPLHPGSPTPDATCSTCDDAAIAQSQIGYYGRGEARVTWNVDGVTMQQTMALGPSAQRQLVARPQPGYTPPPIIVDQSKPFDTPSPLTTKDLGIHAVSVSADVAPDPALPNLPLGIREAVGRIAGSAGGALDANAAASAKSVLNSLSPPPGSNLPPLKVGILSTSKSAISGLGPVQYVNGPMQSVAAMIAGMPPDQHVASSTRYYDVVQSDPSKPCKFLFPVTSGGAFEIEDIQGNVTQQGTKYSGSGNLVIHLANASSGGYDIYQPIPIHFADWDVPDGSTVAAGTLDVAPNLQLHASAPGITGTIDRIQGHTATNGGAVQGEVDATLSVAFQDDTLRLPGVEKPQQWSGVSAELHANGDWMKDGLNLPNTMIGWSGFQIASSNVRLDLSHTAGDGASPYCGSLGGGDWVGVRFPALTVIPYTMGLVTASALQPVVNDWGVINGGLCGSLTTGPFSAPLEAGNVSFQSINAYVAPGSGDFKATYKGINIYVPWLDTHITGDGQLVSGGGKQASITFPSNTAPVTKTYGNISFTAKNLQFTQVQGMGWAVQTSTTYTFNAEGKKFVSIPLTPFTFGMDGRAYLANGAPSTDVPLSGASTLGQTPLDLVSAHLSVPLQGSQVLDAQFNTTVHLSEVMPSAPMVVNYEMDSSGSSFTSKGPENTPFSIDVPYPSGQPTSEARIHPVYGTSSGTGTTEYSGTVDLSELGGPPLTAQFRLGYANGHDYWLARATLGLGDTGVPIIPVPPVMNLYSISGGMGHNFPLNAFTDTGDLKAATPVFDNSFLFMAGMRVGMPDHFTYTVDGDLTIKATGQDAGARMDFHAWLLKLPDNGNGDFQGYFQYAGSNFDGRLWGHMSFLNDLAYLDLGNSANNAAIDMHFGNGPWHIDAGKKEGPRIHGHFLVSDADMYFMLSDQGLSMGGGVSIDLDVGDDSVASAYVRGSVDAGVTITPQPHISGDFSANASAGVCVSGVCVSDWVSAQIHAEAMPLDINASASLGLPWPLGSVSFSVHL